MNDQCSGRRAVAAIAATLAIGIAGMPVPRAVASEAETLEVDEARAGTLLLATPFDSRAATRVNTDVDITVSGLIACTTIGQEFRQKFRNDGTDRVEGPYVFLPGEPLPDRRGPGGLPATAMWQWLHVAAGCLAIALAVLLWFLSVRPMHGRLRHAPAES